jgi:molybdenum cofactor biosynthesis protein B
VADERQEIAAAISRLASTEISLIVTTGGTGFGPRDVTPEATRDVITREAPGLAELMRAAGLAKTPMAALSRGIAGSVGSTLVVNLPGSPKGARESLDALSEVLGHALDLLAGDTQHATPSSSASEAEPVDEEDTRPADETSAPSTVTATVVAVHGEPPCSVGQKIVMTADGPLSGTLGCSEFDAAALADAGGVIAASKPVTNTYEHELGSVDVYLEPQGTARRLIVLSASPVALHLLRLVAEVGYETTLIEGRTERITGAHRSGAGSVVTSIDQVDLALGWDAIATDHDDPALARSIAALLNAPTSYLAVMGSKRHVGPHIQQLRDAGFEDDELARIETPAGIPLGSRDAAVIALSLTAGLVAHRNRS